MKTKMDAHDELSKNNVRALIEVSSDDPDLVEKLLVLEPVAHIVLCNVGRLIVFVCLHGQLYR